MHLCTYVRTYMYVSMRSCIMHACRQAVGYVTDCMSACALACAWKQFLGGVEGGKLKEQRVAMRKPEQH